jgi:hypothetical protein
MNEHFIRKWKDVIKMDPKKFQYEDIHWFSLFYI